MSRKSSHAQGPTPVQHSQHHVEPVPVPVTLAHINDLPMCSDRYCTIPGKYHSYWRLPINHREAIPVFRLRIGAGGLFSAEIPRDPEMDVLIQDTSHESYG
ncbi:Uu.00g115380.m01.CDS01 [Anthostomella pinea]|uniref:Uu.00g115380.m01.CDS01 n=1 Tax=Anthostomella pinea TaxID=933095 RepID=A0AAI8VFT3_9PEZI|nr:Uu.00g115380.m01.CDS01 [Anthostomella pinea]